VNLYVSISFNTYFGDVTSLKCHSNFCKV